MQSGKENESLEEMLAKNDWYGASRRTQDEPLIDVGKGNKLSWRTFIYERNKDLKQLPSRQELFNIHWQQIEDQLWKDGFVVEKRIEPKVVVSDDGKRYVIAVMCAPQFNSNILDNPKTLQDYLSGNR